MQNPTPEQAKFTTALAWIEVGKVIERKMFDPATPGGEYFRLIKQFRAVSDQWIEEFASCDADSCYREAFNAVIEHGSKKQAELLKRVVITSERNGIVFATAPSCSVRGKDYTCTLNVGTRTHSCNCPGHASHGHCWHTDELAERYTAPQLITVENMLQASFDALDTLDDVPAEIGYESELLKPERPGSITPELRTAKAASAKDFDYVAYFEGS